jgi:peptide/histidine transporter 3/4
MATSARVGEGITLIKPCSDDINKLTESASGIQEDGNRHGGRRTDRQRRKWRLRGIGSSSLLLILTWGFIISCSINFTQETFDVYYQVEKERTVPLWVVEANIVVISSLSCITIPIVSLIAEVAIGRYKLVSYSLKAMWFISIVGSVITICGETLPATKALVFIAKLFLLVPQYMLLGAFIASAIPLGIDQVTSGSNTNISAFVTWLGWGSFCGFSIPGITGSVFYNCTHLMESEVRMIMSLLPVLLLSVGLILDFHFHHKLVKEPVTVNPVSLIFKVLKYAAKHKYPVQRSAFTYCENERPTRLDYGKSKYGGPFTTEQVEDVKTFGRVLVVIVVIGISAVTFMAQCESQPAMEESFGLLHHKENSVASVARQQLISMSSIMVTIPLYELLIYPCLRNRGPSILQSAGIGAAALIVSSLYGVVTEAILFDGNTGCMFVQNSHNAREVGILINIPFQLILAFAIVVLLKSSTEFVCAQAPYNMKGFLIGLFFTTMIFFICLGTLLFLVWNNKWFPILHTSTCGIWFYLSTLVLAVVSSALLGLVIRWYKARERDEITRSQDLVEEVYHKYQEQASQE